MTQKFNCQSLLNSLSEYVDGTLRDELCRQIENHLSECEDCRVVVDTLKKTIYLYHTTSRTDMPPEVRERLFRRLDLENFLKPTLE
jgi:anti-sigma factor (TIGR02949 family)